MMIYTQNTFLYDKESYSVGLSRSAFTTNYYFLKNRYFKDNILFHEYVIPKNTLNNKIIYENNYENNIYFLKKKNFLKIIFVSFKKFKC